MSRKRYWMYMFPFCFIGIPVAVQLAMGALGMATAYLNSPWSSAVMYAGAVLALYGMWGLVAKKGVFSEDAFTLYVPIFSALCYYMLIFVVPFGLGGYAQDDELLGRMLVYGGIFWLPTTFILSFMGNLIMYPILQMGVYMLSALFYGIHCARYRRQIVWVRQSAGLLCAVVLLCGISGYQLYARNQNLLSRDRNIARVEDEVYLYDYVPFREDNKLWVPSEPPHLSIDSDYPRLDGATAAYPVYAAMTQAIYKGLDERTVQDYVDCSKTDRAYNRLIQGDIDIFFGAQPSEQQRKMAGEQGVEFHMIPIAKEAFVFFVNSNNTIDRLTVEEIQDIYQKKITNWSALGGDNMPIMPFQRPENSGSQTIMLKMMAGKKLPKPLREEYAQGMGGIINEVAAYRNYLGAIGYSFRYYATGMNPNNGIRLLAVNDIEPTVENIRDKTYPFTVDVYAVMTKEPEGNEKALMDWILSPEGQQMIENCGYVGL